MNFNDYLKAQGKSQNTVNYYSYCVNEFKRWLKTDNTELEAVTAATVMAWLDHLKTKGQNSQTRSLRLTAINHLFDWMIDCGELANHPARHIRLRGKNQNKLYPILKRDQLESIYLDYVVPEENDPRSKCNWFRTYLLGKRRNKVILGMMVYQGLTTNEVTKIELKDLNLRAGTVYIKGSRKSNARTLELKPGQIMGLMEYQMQIRPEILTYYTKPLEELFLSLPVSGRKAAVNAGNIWKRLSTEIRQQHSAFINFKQVRTSVIVSWLSAYNLREVQYMAGHRFVSSTERYYLHHIEDLQTDIDKFHPLG